MTEPAPPQPPRTWRPMILWSAAIVLVLGLAVGTTWVVTSVRQVGKALRGCSRSLTDPYSSQREWIENSRREIDALGGDRAAARKICCYLRTPRRWAPDRREAAMLLGACGERNVPELARLLEDGDDQVRVYAAWALGILQSPGAVEPLVRRLENEKDGWARRNAAWALGEIADARAVGPLGKALQDGDDSVRRAAADGLGNMGPAAAPAVPQLIRAIKDRDSRVGRSAITTLGNIGPGARGAVPALIAKLGNRWDESFFFSFSFDRDARPTRVLAAEALGAIGPDAREAIPALEASTREARSPLAALDAIHPEIRKAVEAMFQKEDPDALKKLEAQFKKDAEPFRTAASEALKEIRSGEPPKTDGPGKPGN